MGGSYACRVEQVRHPRSDAVVVRVERQHMEFSPGQHVTLGLWGGGINREYSIYSGTSDPWLEFLVKVHPASDSAQALRSVRAGETVTVGGPYGAFTLPPTVREGQPTWLIAAGVGIAPFHSMVRSFPGLNYHVLHGVREAGNAYDRHDYQPERYQLCCSQSSDGDFRGRVTDWLKVNRIPDDATAFICGSATMIAETYECLRFQGLSSDRLFTEVFF